ncbi:hypothetical protein J2S70_000581 [Trueperella bonasi]|uniref:Rhamnan synthesis protein F n=1 Tax=Trueperella bonasi TaxID=312286 RepID=A0ABT9NF32_9ACTO|nr:rhamnan synthesis F family protein [Trueperella bonasi]MDP9805999.1 hypothetical protein [Trueperella bonasi]
MTIARKLGPLVSSETAGRIRLEKGKRDTIRHAERVALIAQYSTTPRQSRSLSIYARSLADNGFLPIIIAVTEGREELKFPFGLPAETIILRRPNLGYDFGSWATALGMFPEVRNKTCVLITNDSMIGPFDSITPILRWISEPGQPNIRALTSSDQISHHLQSFFVCFRGGILADRPWVDFFNGIRVQDDKDSVVMRYELGMSKLAFYEGYTMEEWVSGSELGVPFGNPTVEGWQRLIESGVPFIKRTLLTHPATEQEGSEARSFIKNRFGHEITEW